MTPLVDHLYALLGRDALAEDGELLADADARAAKLLRTKGVLHSDAVQAALDEMTSRPACLRPRERVAYYLGMQIGWRAAQRLR